MYILSVFLCCAAALGLYLPMLHIFQLEGYVVSASFGWIRKNAGRMFSAAFFAALAAALTAIFCPIAIASVLICSAAAVFVWISSVRLTLGKAVKKKIVFTPRMRRLSAMTLILWLVSSALCLISGYMLVFTAVLAAVMPVAAGWIIEPLEKAINQRYFNDAKSRLEKRSDLIKIGVTGSYGKTSVKFILAALLGEKYNVLASPSSFNTPMGLTRVIREQLKDEHQVFIAEMGARHVGDIEELCGLVKPKYGLITSVGKQHLETFFTLENIINTKFELIEALPEGGKAFFADDGNIVRGMYKRSVVESVLTGFCDGCAVRAEDISVGPNGSSFSLCYGEEKMGVTTKLLGRHNISNIVLCCAVALELGVSGAQIKAALGKLEPIEHRLQLIKGAGGLTIIDDAFNSNPSGAKYALDVIKSFSGRRVIITPGMVELGGEEEALNREFGRQMAESVDTAILLGEKRSRPIKQGLIEAGFEKGRIVVAETLNEAMALLPNYAGAGDVLLFENDLPDNY